MRKVIRIDKCGFYVEDVVLQDIDLAPYDCVDLHCPDGLYKPKWTGSEWVEGLSKSEIEELKSNPIPKNDIEELKEQVSALQDALLFLMG